jgi:hypothetical protein
LIVALLDVGFAIAVEAPAAMMPTRPTATSVAASLRETFYNLVHLRW